MEKVEVFKKLCKELQKQKLELDKDVNRYADIAAHLYKSDVFVTPDGIVDVNKHLTDDEKKEIEDYLHEVEKKIKKQSEWIKERQKAFSEALDEMKGILESYLSPPYLEYFIKKIQNIATYNDLLAIEFGESLIRNGQWPLSAN